MGTAVDNFDRAAENPIASPWVSHSANAVQLSASACRGTAAAWSGARYASAGLTWGNDQYASGLCTYDGSINTAGGVEVRCSAAGDSAYVFSEGGTVTTLWSLSAGVFTSLATSSHAALADGATRSLRIQAVGTAIAVLSSQGTFICSATNTNYAAGVPGVLQYGAVGTDLNKTDNWWASAFADAAGAAIFHRRSLMGVGR